MLNLSTPVVHGLAYVTAASAMPVLASLRGEGNHHVPASGPALLVANHQSFIDPVLLGLTTPRRLCYLARKTLFKKPLFAWLIRSLRAIPIDQESVGKDGIKAILAALQTGEAVVVFPEGERTHDGTMSPLRPGVSLLIQRAKAPIVPVGLAGAFEFWPRTRKLPRLAPLFFPANGHAMAFSVGPPLDPARLATLPREQALGVLFEAIHRQQLRAERLRRKE
jgi:1-acyl-sn-glycerol-3-phosphate acyltransferase